MNGYFSAILLILLTGVLLTVPIVPAIVELQRKTDAQPLLVIQKHAGEIRHFSDGFRAYISELKPILQACQNSGRASSGTLKDKAPYLVLGGSPDILLDKVRSRDGTYFAVIVACSDLFLPSNTTFRREFYSKGKFVGDRRNNYRAILGENDVRIGPNSIVMRWAHSVGVFSASYDCGLYGRISSDTLIHLERGCKFVRLNAPRIELGSIFTGKIDSPKFLPDAPLVPKRFLYDNDFELQAGQMFRGNVVTRGNFIARKNTKIIGSVKSNKKMTLEEGVLITGSVISSDHMEIGSNCILHGPVIAERALCIESGTRLGTQTKPTTVSSPKIFAKENVVIFGTLWAREHGEVVGNG